MSVSPSPAGANIRASMVPSTQYARNGDVSIAYSVSGAGPVDIVFSTGFISHVEHLWEEPGVRRFLERLGMIGRLVIVDRRGGGMSDPLTPGDTLDDEVADLDAVLDAVGSKRTALVGYTSGGPLCIKYAVERPDRVSHLVLYASIARHLAGPGYDFTHDEAARQAAFEEQIAQWGQGNLIDRAAPSRAADPAMRAWAARLERLAASPGALRAAITNSAQVDVTELLGVVAVPTLVMHRRGDQLIDIGHSRYIAEHVPGARLVEFDGVDSLISAGDAEEVLSEIEEFLTGGRAGAATQRALRTVLFTDIVDATAQAARMGDSRWRDLLATHDSTIRHQLDRHSGTEVKTTGDGILATFAGPPSDAVRCARDIVAELESLGITVRAGLHTGECELIGADVGGMAVHIASRVAGLAGAGELLASGTVFGTVVGAGFHWDDRGSHDLKGVPGAWPIFALQ